MDFKILLSKKSFLKNVSAQLRIHLKIPELAYSNTNTPARWKVVKLRSRGENNFSSNVGSA